MSDRIEDEDKLDQRFDVDLEVADVKHVNQNQMMEDTSDSKSDKTNLGLICSDCGKRFLSKQSLRFHMTSHTGEKPFNCHLCPYKGVKKNRLVTHIINRHGEEELKNAILKPKRLGTVQVTQFFHCPTCDKQCTSKQNLENHMKLHGVDRPFNCPKCSYTAIQKQRMDSHMLYHHGGMEALEGTLSCPKCPRIVHTREYLKRHMLIHDEVKPHACPTCHDTFRHKISLFRHMQQKHPEENNGNGDTTTTSTYYSSIPCHECGRILANRFSFKKHMRLHGRKPLSCSHCEKVFKRKGDLNRHLRMSHKKDESNMELSDVIVGL